MKVWQLKMVLQHRDAILSLLERVEENDTIKMEGKELFILRDEEYEPSMDDMGMCDIEDLNW